MIRILGLLIGLACAAICLSEAVVCGMLWQKGYLTSENMDAVRAVFSDTEDPLPDVPEDSVDTDPDIDEVLHERSLRILQLESRERELQVLQRVAAENAEGLLSKQKTFQTRQQEFDDRLAALEAELADQAVEQSRLVLLAMPPANAVERLMALSLDENVYLMQGMPEKSIAKILQEFDATPEQETRVRELFAALLRGDPQRSLIEATRGNRIDAVPPNGPAADGTTNIKR